MIDKQFPMMPQGLPQLAEDPIEIEIENPDDVTLSAGGVEIDLMPEKSEPTGAKAHDANLAEHMDEDDLNTLAADLLAEVQADRDSRKEWVDVYAEGLDTLGLQIEDRSEPWEGACGLVHPLMIEAAVRFQSETITEVFPAAGPVKAKILGRETPAKKEVAGRVQDDMNYRLTEEMAEYRTEHEKLLFNLALAGSAFKKVYYDPALGRQAAVFVPAEDFIMPYGVSNVASAHRKTHVMRKTANEMKKLMVSGFYRDIELPEPSIELDEIQEKKAEKEGAEATNDDRHTVYEVHCELDLPGFEDKDGIALPYIVAIEKSSAKVLAIYRNWDEKDELKLPQHYFVGYNYVTGFGAYGFGLIHLIGALCKGATSILRQLVDAGTLANLPGGLKARGLRIKDGNMPIRPGEFRDVDLPSGTVKDSIMTLPFKEPSQVLLALMNTVVEDTRRLAATADLKISDMSAQAPVGTTLALLERQLKVMSAVQARVHNAMKEEFKLLKRVIRDYTSDDYEYDVDNERPMVKGSDYDMVEVIPVSDPNAATMSQRIAQAQAALQLSQSAPQVYDLPQLHRSILESIGIKNAAEMVPLPDDKTRKPKDPVSENMAALVNQPIKAFMYQDHKAHIAAHEAFLNDPKMQMVMQTPAGQALGPALMAHIQEHMAFQYRRDIEALIGMPLPAPSDEMPPELELQISAIMAQAAGMLLQKSQQEAQQQMAQQMAQDPVIQAQQKELELKQLEMERKARNDQFDFDVAMERLAVERERLDREDQRAREKQRSDNIKSAVDLQLRAAKGE